MRDTRVSVLRALCSNTTLSCLCLLCVHGMWPIATFPFTSRVTIDKLRHQEYNPNNNLFICEFEPVSKDLESLRKCVSDYSLKYLNTLNGEHTVSHVKKTICDGRNVQQEIKVFMNPTRSRHTYITVSGVCAKTKK